MVPSEINDKELLYRAVPNKPQLWKEKDNRPSSALFKDSKGVSVDRDGNRPDNEIVENFKSKFPCRAVVKVTAGKCRELEALVLAKPLEDNPFHAEIHNNREKIQLSSSKARKLSKAVDVILLN